MSSAIFYLIDGCFQFLTLTNNALINILEQLYIQAYFFSKIRKGRVEGSKSKHMLFS